MKTYVLLMFIYFGSAARPVTITNEYTSLNSCERSATEFALKVRKHQFTFSPPIIEWHCGDK